MAVDEDFIGTYKAEVRAGIAARVLAGLAASGRITTAAQAADSAVEMADALIERLEKAPASAITGGAAHPAGTWGWVLEQMQPKEKTP